MAYSGKIERKQKQERIKTDFMPLVFWVLGVLFSFLPLFIDVCVYLLDHPSLDKKFWINVCLRGDLLCIIATVLILSIMEVYKNNRNATNRLDTIIVWIGTFLCVIMFSVWSVFKYLPFPQDYEGFFPVIITIVFFIIGFSISSRLQVRLLEVNRNA